MKLGIFSFFALYSLLLLSFFLYLKSVPIHVIAHVYIYVIIHVSHILGAAVLLVVSAGEASSVSTSPLR